MVSVREHLQQSCEAEKRYHESVLKSTREEYDSIQKKLQRLLHAHLSGSITLDEYDKTATELKQRQYELNEKLQTSTEADEKFSMTVTTLMDIASQAHELFESSKVEQKRKIIGFVLSNLQLRGEKLEFTVNSPFDLLVNLTDRSQWRARRDSNSRSPDP